MTSQSISPYRPSVRRRLNTVNEIGYRMHTSIVRIGRSLGVPTRPRIARPMATSPSCITAGAAFFLDPFALRQWDDPEYKGTRLTHDKVQTQSRRRELTAIQVAFLEKLHALYDNGVCGLKDGYAPFCKHLFVKNFVGVPTGAISITEANRKLLRSGYTRRRAEELAVLTREQIVKESQTLDGGRQYDIPDVPWGIISIKAQMEDYETPMQPITIMRNALGTEYGGSGVQSIAETYNASVTYWETHALVL